MTGVDILAAASLAAAQPGNVAAMRWTRRVLLIGFSTEDDPELVAQRRILGRWEGGRAERDLSVVEVVADRVAGATDSAAALRHEYRLVPNAFTLILIGKDGGVKPRSAKPVAASVLEHTIDAMPMRRAGGR